MSLKIKKHFLIGLGFALVFFLIGLFTINDYNFTSDSEYLYGTGEIYLKYGTQGHKVIQGYSDARYYGPIGPISSALSYKMFNQKFGLDFVTSRHVLIILIGAVGVFFTFMIGYDLSNTRTGLIAAFFLAAYPFFFAHSHNNISDIPLLAFFTFTVWCFLRAVNTGKKSYIILFPVLFGLAFDSKAQAGLLVLITVIWLAALFLIRKRAFIKLVNRNIPKLLYWIISPIIFFITVIVFHPWLWSKPVDRFFQILEFFRHHTHHGKYLYLGSIYTAGIDMPWHYAFVQIFISTPVILLVFLLIGIYVSVKNSKKGNSMYILLWFFVPLLFISIMSVTVYGGIRQLIFLLPALSLLGALGFNKFLDFVDIKLRIPHITKIVTIALVLLYLIPVVSYYPYQNSYFNEIVGGANGAYETMNLNNFNQGFKQNVAWLNSNADKDTTVVIDSPIKFYKLRPDLMIVQGLPNYFSDTRSQNEKAFYYVADVLLESIDENFNQEIIHQETVDGVPVNIVYQLTKKDV